MPAAVAVGEAFSLLVHAKEFGVGPEKGPRQQFFHRVQLVFHSEVQLAALFEKALAVLRLDPADDGLRRILMVDSNCCEARLFCPPGPIFQTQVFGNEHDAARRTGRLWRSIVGEPGAWEQGRRDCPQAAGAKKLTARSAWCAPCRSLVRQVSQILSCGLNHNLCPHRQASNLVHRHAKWQKWDTFLRCLRYLLFTTLLPDIMEQKETKSTKHASRGSYLPGVGPALPQTATLSEPQKSVRQTYRQETVRMTARKPRLLQMGPATSTGSCLWERSL